MVATGVPNQASIEWKLESLLYEGEIASRPVVADDLNGLGITSDQRLLKNCFFERDVSLQSQAIGQGSTLVFLGAHSYVNPNGYLRGGVFIGRYCSIGRRVTIGAGMHNMASLSTSPILRARARYTTEQRAIAGIAVSRLSKEMPTYTVLENDVWIGDGVVVLPGVRIATGVVIGANSVVTRDVEPYMVVGGVPAKPIRCRFAPAVVEALLATRYWDYPTEAIKALPCGNVLEFIDAVRSADLARENFETFRLIE